MSIRTTQIQTGTREIFSVSRAFLALLFSTLFIYSYYRYLYIVYPDVAYGDTLHFLTYFDGIYNNKISWLSIWYQGDHHGLLQQIYVYVNARFFHLNIFMATALTGVVLSIMAATIYFSIKLPERGTGIYPVLVRNISESLVFLITLACLFSLCNWEAFTIDLSTPVFGKNAVFLLYWVGLNRVFDGTAQHTVLKTILVILTPVIVLLIGFGWSYAFVVSSLACIFLLAPAQVLGEPSLKFKWVLAASLIGSIVVYVVGGYLLRSQGSFSPPGYTPTVKNVLMAYIYAISSIFFDLDVTAPQDIWISWRFLGAYALIALAAILMMLRVFYRVGRETIVPYALLIYGAFDAAAVAFGRGRFDPEFGGASRYYMDFSLIMIGAAWASMLAIMALPNPTNVVERQLKMAVPVLFGFCTIIFCVGQEISYERELVIAPYRRIYFENLRAITLRGNITDADAKLLQFVPIYAAAGVEVERKYQLGPFRYASRQPLDVPK